MGEKKTRHGFLLPGLVPCTVTEFSTHKIGTIVTLLPEPALLSLTVTQY